MSCGFGCGASSSCAKGPYCSSCGALPPIGVIPPPFVVDPIFPGPEVGLPIEGPGLIDDVIIGTGMARGMRREARREIQELGMQRMTNTALAMNGWRSYPGAAPLAQAAIAGRAIALNRPFAGPFMAPLNGAAAWRW
jgi:hypothetical protein